MNEAKRTLQFAAMEGKKYKIGRLDIVFKRVDDEAEGGYSVFESTEPAGAGASVHRHPGFQETFIVLDGTFDFVVSGENRQARAGDVIVVPRGAPHAFSCTSAAPGRMLTISTPAGVFEAFIADVCAAQVDTGKPGGAPAVDFRAIATKHGIEFL